MTQATTPDGSQIAAGSILLGKYRIERVIGRGGMGMVVEARHLALDERVALKFLTPEYATHPEASARFLREARAAIKIKSEHVARVSDVGKLDNGAPYMVMEYLEGADLSHHLEHHGVLPISDAIDFIIQGCEAIAEAHSLGIVHRDIKPANLFLTKRIDGAPLVKVLDFGISKVTGESTESLTRTTAAMGSALYMSPEQMQQTRSVDHRTDIYALGVSLYELLAGQQPFYAETLPQLCAAILTGIPTPIREKRPDLPEHLAQCIETAYARDRGARYQSVAELVIALAPYAPPRSQSTIERVARMAGLPVPIAGSAPTPPNATTPPGGLAPRTQVLPSYSTGPASAHAAAAFANGAVAATGNPTAPAVSTTGSAQPASAKANNGARVAVALLAVGLVVSAIGGLVLVKRGDKTDIAPAAITGQATPAPPTSEAGVGPSTAVAASAAPSAEAPPVLSASAAPSASASTAPARASAPAIGRPVASSPKVAVGSPPTSPPPAVPATSKPNVLDMR